MDEAKKDQQLQPHEEKDLVATMDQLTEAVNRLNETQKKIEKQYKLGPTIIRATFYALGSTLGLSLVFAILFYILNKLGILGSLGDWLNSAKDIKNLY